MIILSYLYYKENFICGTRIICFETSKTISLFYPFHEFHKKLVKNQNGYPKILIRISPLLYIHFIELKKNQNINSNKNLTIIHNVFENFKFTGLRTTHSEL